MLKARGRTRFPGDVAPWRREQLAQGMVVIAVDGEVGIQAVALADFHADPADRLIVATALRGHALATADKRILDWTGDVDVLDARREKLPVTYLIGGVAQAVAEGVETSTGHTTNSAGYVRHG